MRGIRRYPRGGDIAADVTIGIHLEPEPLAFRVRPQAEECVDSWLDRLTAAHETTRSALFRHLGINPALASMDLARGKVGLDPTWHAALDHLVERLAWAVQTGSARVEQSFLACEAEALLPRRLRRYACARCWYEARLEGKPLIILREWILRACWRCSLHEAPLSDMAEIGRWDEAPRRRIDLVDLVFRAERLRWKIPVRPGAIWTNATFIETLVGSAEGQDMTPPARSYQEKFSANLFHYSADRIALLVLAHSGRPRGVRRFERLIATRLPERPTPGGGTLDPEKRSYRRMSHASSRPRAFAASLYDLLCAYSALFDLQNRARSAEVRLARMEQLLRVLRQRPVSTGRRPTARERRPAG